MPFKNIKYKPPYIPHKDYEDRVVAFIDILGFSNLVTQSGNDVKRLRYLTSAMDTFHNIFWTWETDGCYSSFAFTQFSDSIVISAIADTPDSFEMLQQLLCGIMMLAEEYGILVRGGITRGQLIHDDTLLVGPAMVKAYHMESKCAIYPRIIIDEHLKKSFDENIEHYVRNYTNIPNIPSQDFIFKKDFDSWWYIDYVHPSNDYVAFCRTINNYYEYQSKLLDIVENGLKDTTPNVKTKYQWLSEKLQNKV